MLPLSSSSNTSLPTFLPSSTPRRVHLYLYLAEAQHRQPLQDRELFLALAASHSRPRCRPPPPHRRNPCPHHRHQTPRRHPRLHRVRPRCCAVAPKLSTTARGGLCLDHMQEAPQACRESGLAVGSATGTNLKVRTVTTQLGGEVGAIEVAHTLRVGLLGRGA
eukprot:scaffold109328_cov69-Phaeocystis_antarctica.AAC.1